MDANLPLAHFRLEIRARTPIQFHHYSGSAWRGLMGHELKKTACVTQETACPNCMLYRRCVYSYLFETPPPENSQYMRRSTAAPHPFVLAPDPGLRRLDPGQSTWLGLVLIGNAVSDLPYFVHVFQRAGERGIGPDNGLFELVNVEQAERPGGLWKPIYGDGELRPYPAASPEPPAISNRVVMRFESPTRLKYQDRFLSPRYFSASSEKFVGALRRRQIAKCMI